MIKVCKHCGKTFEAPHPNTKFCSYGCRSKYHMPAQVERNARNRERRKQLEREQKTKLAESKPTKSIEQWQCEADECGLDYGTYRTLVEQCGKTYEELCAAPRNRQVHAHSRQHRDD